MSEYKDKFTEAEKEQQEKSAFKCETCNKEYPKAEAEKHKMTCCERSVTERVREGFGP